MARGRSTIVGGGVALGSPQDVGALTRIVNTDPPTIADSIAWQRTQGGQQVVTVGLATGADWPLSNTYTERLQVVGGIISDTGAGHDNLVLGRGASARQVANGRNTVLGTLADCDAGNNSIGNVVIGYAAAVALDRGGDVVIGDSAFHLAPDVGAAILIGQSCIGGNGIASGFSGVAIGTSVTALGSGVLIGNQASASNVGNYVGIGASVDIGAASSVAVGDNAEIDHANSIVLGRNAISIAAGSFVVGGQNLDISTVLIGGGDLSAAPANLLYRHTNATGTDTPGMNVTIRASLGTGNAATAGRIIFETGTPGASGVVGQTPAGRLEIRPPGTNGAAVNFLGTSGAAAAVGTLNNAPTAGDPADWVPILFNGNVRYLPAWA